MLRNPYVTREPDQDDDEDDDEEQFDEVHYDKDNDDEKEQEGLNEDQVSSAASTSRRADHDAFSDSAPLSVYRPCPRFFKSSSAAKKVSNLVVGLLALATVGILLKLLVNHVKNHKASSATTTTTTSHPQGDGTFSQNRDHSPDRQARWDAITELLETKGLASPSQFLEPTAPQTRTLDWLVYEDQILTPLDTPVLQGRFIQRYTLILFAFTTGVELWEALNPWTNMVQTHECSFDGIDCNDEGQVVSIRLKGWRLSGSLPEELGRVLTQLSSLVMSHNKLEGTIPETLFQLTQLETLDLFDNNLQSTISPSIRALTKLKNLYLGKNKLTGSLPIESLQALPMMERFLLTDNQVSGPILDAVMTWHQLISLGLELLPNIEPATIGGSDIGRLTKLQDLVVDIVYPALPTEIGLLTDLQNLYIGATTLGDLPVSSTIPTEIGNLAKLQEFALKGNRFITGTIPTEIGRLGNLTLLDFTSNYFEGDLPTELGLLTNLTMLFLGDCQGLEGTVPSELGKLAKHIDLIALQGTLLKGTLPEEFCSSDAEIYTRCEFLTCDCCSELVCA